MKKDNKDNVIDMTERIQEPDTRERVKHLKVRFDLERAKVGLSASILSIVIVVTLANSKLLRSEDVDQPVQSRGIASVPTGTSDAEDSLVHQLASKDLGQNASVGQRPSAIEKLAFGFLEGHYAIRLTNGKLAELEKSGDQGKQIDDIERFLEANRDVLPVSFDKSVRVGHDAKGDIVTESWQLLNSVSRPMANVTVKMDASGRLLGLRVSMMQLASK
ncbi:MAG: hypothetical protein V4760_10000 [Bdellovibrionota bacterium]